MIQQRNKGQAITKVGQLSLKCHICQWKRCEHRECDRHPQILQKVRAQWELRKDSEMWKMRSY